MRRKISAILALLLTPSTYYVSGAQAETGVQRQQRLSPQVSTQVEPNTATTASSSVLFYAFRVGNYTNSTNGTEVPVPIDNGGDTSRSFTTTESNQLIIINYNAECGALGNPDDEDYLAIEIKIDGKQTYPNSGSAFAFCTATSATDFSWVGASRQAATHVANPGNHKIEVDAIGEAPTEWWLGDSSLTIFSAH